MQKHTMYKVIMLFSALFMFVSLCSGILILTMFDLQELDSTRELKGTVEKIIIPESENGNAFIYTKEHDNHWTIDSSAYRYLASEGFEKLSNGDEITFRIAADDFDNYSESMYTNIVCLESSDEKILSIDGYNKGMKRGCIYYLCICLFVLVISVVGFIFGFRSIRNVSKIDCKVDNTDFLQEMKRIDSQRRSKSLIIIYVVALVALIALLRSNLVCVFVSENNTTEITGTVSKTLITESTNGDVIELHTKEHANYWYINSEAYDTHIIESISKLEDGQHVKIRILKYSSDDVNNAVFINVVSLETDYAVLISLENYTDTMLENNFSTIVLLSCGCLFCIVALISNLLPAIRVRRQSD